MDRVRSVNSVASVTTFAGPLDFLDSQSSFDLIFGLHPTMLRISKRGHNCCATEDTDYLAAKLRTFIQSCQLHIFCDAVQLQYVGTKSFDSNKMLADISLALSSLKMVSNHQGRTISLTPDDLFSHFAEFLPLLSPNAMTWSFSLVTLFFNALPSSKRKSSARPFLARTLGSRPFHAQEADGSSQHTRYRQTGTTAPYISIIVSNRKTPTTFRHFRLCF